MAHGSVEQGVLSAKHLESHIPCPADKFSCLGYIAAGILHSHDIGDLMSQALHQLSGHGIVHPSRIVVQKHRGLRHTFRYGLKMKIKLILCWFQKHGLQHGYACCPVVCCHLSQTAAFFCADCANAEINGHTPR